MSETYEGQLAARAAELLPGIGADERLELLGVMSEDELRFSLAFLISYAPATFDACLVRDRALAVRLQERLDEHQDDDLEPFCTTCGGTIGIFLNHGQDWHHYTGEGAAASPVELFDAGHEPTVAWREPAGGQ